MKKLSLSLLLLFLPSFAHAEWGQFDFQFDAEKPWVEIAARLPPPPKTENLIAFEVSPATQNQYFIDGASLSVDADQVVRYTVVIQAAGGARNVGFEGMRCATGERRFYAYGRPDNTWSRARQSAWTEIDFRSALSYHKALFEAHFCPDGMPVADAAQAVASLRRAAR